MGKRKRNESEAAADLIAAEAAAQGKSTFWCSDCQNSTLVEDMPPVIYAMVKCPFCGAEVRFRGRPSGKLVLG